MCVCVCSCINMRENVRYQEKDLIDAGLKIFSSAYIYKFDCRVYEPLFFISIQSHDTCTKVKRKLKVYIETFDLSMIGKKATRTVTYATNVTDRDR